MAEAWRCRGAPRPGASTCSGADVADFRINVELGHLIPQGSPLTKDLFPTLSFAVARITEAVHQQWAAYASGAPLPDYRHTTDYMAPFLAALDDPGLYTIGRPEYGQVIGEWRLANSSSSMPPMPGMRMSERIRW